MEQLDDTGRATMLLLSNSGGVETEISREEPPLESLNTMASIISPWSGSASLASPNGLLFASIDDAWEIAMGAPTAGELWISNGMTREACNPSMVWSDDSRYLAVPQWTTGRMQRLMIISVERRMSRYLGGQFRVLELHAFRNGIVSGVDSPIHLPDSFHLNAAGLEW